MVKKSDAWAILAAASLTGSLATATPVGAASPVDAVGDKLALSQALGGIAEPIPLEALREANFGGGLTWTAISAAAFTPANQAIQYNWNFTNGTMGQVNSGNATVHQAPLLLPNGAIVDFVCLVSLDTDSAGENRMFLRVVESDPVPGIVISPFVQTGIGATPGWIGLCNGPLDIPYRSWADLNDNGTPGDVMYSLDVHMSAGNVAKRFVGAVVVWHRTISPAPSTATFSDVPRTHSFFQQIEALVASGVTAGCGSGNYCPNAPLTRGQMAVFLAKALGLHWWQ